MLCGVGKYSAFGTLLSQHRKLRLCYPPLPCLCCTQVPTVASICLRRGNKMRGSALVAGVVGLIAGVMLGRLVLLPGLGRARFLPEMS